MNEMLQGFPRGGIGSGAEYEMEDELNQMGQRPGVLARHFNRYYVYPLVLAMTHRGCEMTEQPQ